MINKLNPSLKSCILNEVIRGIPAVFIYLYRENPMLLTAEFVPAPVIEATQRPQKLFLQPRTDLPEMDNAADMICESCRL